MRFRRGILDGIAAGTVTPAFARGDRPSVEARHTFFAAVGASGISAVERIDAADSTPHKAFQAWFTSLDEPLADPEPRREAPPPRIRFRVADEDPRIERRESTNLSPGEVSARRSKPRRPTGTGVA